MDYLKLQGMVDDEPDQVERACFELLNKNPDDHLALFLLGVVYAKAERYGLAFNVFKRVVDLRPEKAEGWNNVGMALEGMHFEVRARQAFQEAWKREKTNPNYPANIAMTYLEQGEYRKAIEWAEKALKLNQEHNGANSTYGMSLLATGDWAGWKHMAYSVGNKFRKEVSFGEEPRWDGAPGKAVVFYGEQGLGDEIMYASCIPDAKERCKEVILECDKRLEGLFRRSFPSVHVYGTRRQDQVAWLEDHALDARCPVGQLPQFFRPTKESCPGTPYLKADPERRIQWRALLDSLGGKPKIGICWSGGSKHNRREERAVGLKAFQPLMKAIDADWVSLQYKDPSKEIEESGLPVKHWKRACETDDYDDTAALVAELDCVIGVHTSVHHLAGALGVPGYILVPSKALYIYALDVIPWYSSARLFKQREGEPWIETIKRLSGDPSLHWSRPSGSGRISRLLPISNQACEQAGGVCPAGVELAA